MTRSLVILSGLLLLAANAAAAPFGDMTALDIRVENAGDATLDCQAEVAHWFSADLGDVAPAGAATLDLWIDEATGTVATRNALGEFLPVERVWCGVKGRAYDTRWMIPLPRDTAVVTLACAVQANGVRVVCE